MKTVQSMAGAYKTQVAKYGKPISKDLYKELREYAEDHRIRISGFRNFVGEIDTIKTVIDDIFEIAEDFPAILDEKLGVVLELDYDMRDEDFATTDSGHVIHLNALYYSDLIRLKQNYDSGEKEGYFVARTDWRAIARHETGHVVENQYHFDIMGIASSITHLYNRIQLFDYLSDELSIYSASFEDGREIISECFSGHYGRAGNAFADSFVEKCINFNEVSSSTKGG